VVSGAWERGRTKRMAVIMRNNHLRRSLVSLDKSQRNCWSCHTVDLLLIQIQITDLSITTYVDDLLSTKYDSIETLHLMRWQCLQHKIRVSRRKHNGRVGTGDKEGWRTSDRW